MNERRIINLQACPEKPRGVARGEVPEIVPEFIPDPLPEVVDVEAQAAQYTSPWSGAAQDRIKQLERYLVKSRLAGTAAGEQMRQEMRRAQDEAEFRIRLEKATYEAQRTGVFEVSDGKGTSVRSRNPIFSNAPGQYLFGADAVVAAQRAVVAGMATPRPGDLEYSQAIRQTLTKNVNDNG